MKTRPKRLLIFTLLLGLVGLPVSRLIVKLYHGAIPESATGYASCGWCRNHMLVSPGATVTCNYCKGSQFTADPDGRAIVTNLGRPVGQVLLHCPDCGKLRPNWARYYEQLPRCSSCDTKMEWSTWSPPGRWQGP